MEIEQLFFFELRNDMVLFFTLSTETRTMRRRDTIIMSMKIINNNNNGSELLA